MNGCRRHFPELCVYVSVMDALYFWSVCSWVPKRARHTDLRVRCGKLKNKHELLNSASLVPVPPTGIPSRGFARTARPTSLRPWGGGRRSGEKRGRGGQAPPQLRPAGSLQGAGASPGPALANPQPIRNRSGLRDSERSQ